MRLKDSTHETPKLDGRSAKGGLGVIIIVVVLLYFASLLSKGTAEDEGGAAAEGSQATEAQAVVVTSAELAAAYEENEVAAQERFGTQPLLVSGAVKGITLDFMDNAVVQMAGVNQFLDVQATLDDKSVAAALKKGQEVRLLCRKVTEVISAPMLSSCEVVE